MDSVPPTKILGDGVGKESVRKHGGLVGKLASISSSSRGGGGGEKQRQLTKVLLNVNIQNSFGTVQVLMSPDNTVAELMKAAIGIYVKEKRRPLLGSSDPQCFELHLSQFSLESLKPEDRLVDLGSRNFLLCPKPGSAGVVYTAAKPRFPVTKNFTDFLL